MPSASTWWCRGRVWRDERTEQPGGAGARDLQQTLDNKDATAEQIKAKMQVLRDAKTKAREQLAAAQNDLKEMVTTRQEAVLVGMGLLE
jgi:hypothetical protein